MKQIQMDITNRERLFCDKCYERIANGYVWIYIHEDGYVSRLLCEKCHEGNAEQVRYANKEQEVIQLLRQSEGSGDRKEADRIRLILLEGIRTSIVDKSDANRILNEALHKAVSK